MAEGVSYKDVLELLRREILGGKYSSSQKLPSSTALARRFRTTRFTIRQALDRLRQEGLILTQKGRGTFVSKTGRSRLIGLVIPGTTYSSEFFQPIVASLIRLANDNNYTILMEGVWSLNSDDNSNMAIELSARLVRRKVAGVIYQPLEHSGNSEAVNRRILASFDQAGIPVVLLDGDFVSWPDRSEYDLVSIDNIAAGEKSAMHLIEAGARNICFLMRKNWVQNVMNRARGVRNVVLDKGLKWSASSVVFADPADAGEVARIMKRRPRPDAFVCENDVLAADLKLSLENLGYAIPDDVMIAGFDDVQIARLTSPGITTIRQPCEMLARMSFERLLKKMSAHDAQAVQIVCPFKLVPRGSTRRLLSRAKRLSKAAKTACSKAVGIAVFAATAIFSGMAPAAMVVCDVRDTGAVGDGVADDAPAINRALSRPGRPLTVRIPAGTYRIGETLRIGSHTSIEAAEGARLVMSGAWAKNEGDFLLANADPAQGNECISIRGGVWDGNAHDGCNVKPADIFEKGGWSGATLNFAGVKGLRLADMELANSVTYNIRMCRIDGFDISDIVFTASRTGWNQDGLHINGFCRNGSIRNIRAATKGQTNDDLLAFNADDSMSRIENRGMVCGPIENVVVKNVFAEDCHSAVRFLSVTSAIGNVRIEGLRAGCRRYAVNADAARYCRTPLFRDSDRPRGVGRLSNITIDGFVFHATRDGSDPLFCIETNADGLLFKGLVRDTDKDCAPARPFMRIRKTDVLRMQVDAHAAEVPCGGVFALAGTPHTLSIDSAASGKRTGGDFNTKRAGKK
jgi:DNA-binding LacI/PurR family transcriptional regulator